MATSTLPSRKSDALDTWEKLCFERYEAYEQGDKALFQILNNQLKDIRRNCGWTEADISEEFDVYDSLFNQPHQTIAGNPNITYDLIENGQPRNLVWNINQVSIYWKYRQYGKNTLNR